MIILLGTISYATFPKEEMPEIDLKTVAVIIKYDGMSSNEIEKLITEPLERKLMTLKDIKEIISISKDNIASFMVAFNLDTENENLSRMESGAQLIYLAEKAGKLLPTESVARSKVIQWLMFQMGGIGPMMGQANVFFRYWPGEKLQPAIDRYQNEGRRLFEVMETRLKDNEYLADDFSIADIANWCWVRTYKWSGVNIDGLEGVKRWMQMMEDRPACKKGVAVPIDIMELMRNMKQSKDLTNTGSKIIQK